MPANDLQDLMNFSSKIAEGIKTYLHTEHKITVSIDEDAERKKEFGIHVNLQVGDALGIENGMPMQAGDDYFAYEAELLIAVFETCSDVRNASISKQTNDEFKTALQLMETRVRIGMMASFARLMSSYLGNYRIVSPTPVPAGEGYTLYDREGDIPVIENLMRYRITFEIDREKLSAARDSH